MKRLLFLFGILSQVSAGTFDDVLPSTSDEIASLNTDLVIDGFVSAMSGQFSLSEVDLHVKGAQDLTLKRTYIPPQVLGRYHDTDERDRLELGSALFQLQTKGWVILPHLFAGYNRHSPHFQIRDPQGYVLEFEIQKGRGILKTPPFGCSNLCSEEPNSRVDIRNIQLLVEENQAKVLWPDGTTRVYLDQKTGRYRLDRELLPNGKVIQYHWNGKELSRISTTDRSGKYTYAYIDRLGECSFRASDGRKAQFMYEPRTINGKYKKKKLETTFQCSVMTRSENPVYGNHMEYNERMLLNSYDAQNYPVCCTYSQQKGTAARIQTFSNPSSSISFSYDPPIAKKKNGSTSVHYPDGRTVVYRFNDLLLLSSLENWLEGALYNQKIFTYNRKQHIAKVETKDGHGNTLLTKVYECDSSGNATLETHIGDFGTFSIRRTFSKNRLTSEQREDGLSFEYTYLEDTHLKSSTTTLMHGEPLRKTVYLYDEAYNLTEEREEGKTITRYTLYQERPYLHRVQCKEERDWEENLIHKTEYAYDRYGNQIKESHYGADGLFAYCLDKRYDERGNLLEETNPLGQKASYVYDARNRPVEEIPFSNRFTIKRTFDRKGRLMHLQKGKHENRFSYNASDECIEKIDYLGLVTKYTHHPVHGKPTLIQEGATTQEITYDPFGRAILQRDSYGATTQTRFNSYGDPIEIIDPDGGKEQLSYAPNRLLIQRTDPDGLQVHYSYDPLGRLLSQREGSRETTYLYDSYHQIEKKDPLGISTFYTYNRSGQKMRQERAGIITQFSYDPLGFLSLEETEGRNTFLRHDVLGRQLEKEIDHLLKTTYTYDCAGNLASISNGDPTYYTYDCYDRLLTKTNAEGEKTEITYEEGDQVLIQRTLDPRGVETTETYDAWGHLLKRDMGGALVEEFGYDKEHRLIHHDHLAFSYTPAGRLASMCEAALRDTHWTYTPGGKIHSKIKPDGTVIPYTYNSQGELVQMGDQRFQYDLLGRLIEGSGFRRELDAFGNILKEEFATGLTVQTSYDAWNRPIQRILPDETQITYEYEGPFLRKVLRKGIERGYFFNSEHTYVHTYNAYNEKGLVLEETGAFCSHYSYDKVGRRISQQNPFVQEKLAYDLSGNVIEQGNSRYVYDEASQLIAEKGRFQLSYDQHRNRVLENGEEIQVDTLNQRKDVHYDANGNLLKPGFIYNDFDQLIQTETESFTYDALGRRLSSGNTAYFYIGDQEIGSFRNGQIEELIIYGATAPVAIEIKGKPFAPIVDVQNTIRKLVDWKSRTVAFKNSCDAFGKGLFAHIPYAYVGKRYDPSSGLIYFGKRFYDPELGKWLTPDPLRNVDHSNLYQYVLNNPHRFQDPNGEMAMLILPVLSWGAQLALPTLSAYVTAITYGAATAVAAYGTYKLVEYSCQNGCAPGTVWDTPSRLPQQTEVLLKSSESQEKEEYKKPKPGISGKEGAKDIPTWAEGEKPYKSESGKEFAKRLMDEQYGSQQHDTGPGTEFNKLKKYGDRSFE